ncbi:hypothetical protein K505DRAFT_325939, partial [Melanomma pulvis-pyrius CBS 109.77]
RTTSRPTPLPPPPAPLTPAQRSLQARNKPFALSPNNPEPYSLRQRRDQAASILENVETLLWYSAARHESITQTRLHFSKVVLGIEDGGREMEASGWREEWEVPVEERGRPEAGDVEMDLGEGASPARGARAGAKRGRKRHSEA